MNYLLRSIYKLTAPIITVILVCLTGCQTMPSMPALPFSAASAEKTGAKHVQQNTPAPFASASAQTKQTSQVNQGAQAAVLDPASVPKTIVAIWSDAVMRLPGKPATRGLGGRLYFYNNRQEPVPTNGQLIVYGYDDTFDGSQKKTPDRKYVITPEEFPKHYGESEIGPSYSVWIPWDQVGDPQRSVSILPSFTTVEGNLVMGELARHVLPGPKPLHENPQQPAQTTRFAPQITGAGANGMNSLSGHANHTGEIALASYAEAASANGQRQMATALQAPDKLRSMSIRLPQSVKERLANSTQIPSGRDIHQTVTTGGVTQNIGQGNRSFTSMSQAEIARTAAELMQRVRGGASVPPVMETSASATPPRVLPGMVPGQNQTYPMTQPNAGLTPTTHSVPDTPLAPSGPVAPRGLGLPPSARNLSAPPVHSASSPGRPRVRPSNRRTIFPTAAALPVSSPIAQRDYQAM